MTVLCQKMETRSKSNRGVEKRATARVRDETGLFLITQRGGKLVKLVPNEGVKFEDEINKGNGGQKAQKLFRRTKREGKKKVLSLMMMGADDDNDGDA